MRAGFGALGDDAVDTGRRERARFCHGRRRTERTYLRDPEALQRRGTRNSEREGKNGRPRGENRVDLRGVLLRGTRRRAGLRETEFRTIRPEADVRRAIAASSAAYGCVSTKRLTPNGRVVAARSAAISSAICAGVEYAHGKMAKPRAFATAAASSTVAAPPIGASTIGRSRNGSVMRAASRPRPCTTRPRYRTVARRRSPFHSTRKGAP